MNRPVLLTALLALLSGCPETAAIDAGPGDRPDGGGDGGGDAGDGDAGPCGMACTGATSVCDTSSGTCVECLGAGDCAAPTAMCDTSSNTCVACLADGDCTTPSAGRCDMGACVPCTANEQCTEVGAGLCESGTCVQCTAADRTACGTNVCDGSTNTCTTRPAAGADLCQDCVADAECQAGQLCVAMTFMSTDVGQFCLWREDASMPPGPGGSCTNVRPYRQGEELTSVDSVTTRICNLRLTTCAALSQFDTMACTTAFASDDECGVTALDDGLCRMVDAVTNRCTVPCLSDDDCRPGSTCSPAATGYCEF